MPTLSEKIVLITGASSGIGEASAYEFARLGATVIITARRKDRLEQVAGTISSRGGKVFVVPADLQKPKEIANLVNTILEKYKTIDVLLNIAGGGAYKWFETFTQQELYAQFEINLLGPAELTRLVIPVMQKNRAGTIVNVVSYASRIAVLPLTVYASTKYALEGLTDGLRRELAPWGINVIRVHPGGVTGTEYNTKASERAVTAQTLPIGKVTREYVARKLANVVLHPQAELFLGRFYDLAELFNKLFPKLVDLYFYLWVKKKRGILKSS